MITQTISTDLITAMKAREALTVEVLRGVKSSFTNELVAKGMKPTDQLEDEAALAVLRREVKKRKEAGDAFRTAGRAELAEKEDAELAILSAYLPALMSEDDVRKVVLAKKAEMGVSDKKEMGKFMGAVMKDLQGKADGGIVKTIIEESFA